MPATSTRTWTFRTEAGARAAFGALIILLALPRPCAGLRIDRELHPAMPGDAAAPSTAAGPVELRMSPGLSAPAERSAPARRAPAAKYEEMFVEADLNRQDVDKSVLVLRRDDGMFLMRLEDLAAFRLRTPSTAPYVHDGASYFPIDTLPGARFEFDEVRQRLTVMAGAEAFETSAESVPRGKAPQPVRPTFGGFLNYDVNAIRGAASLDLANVEAGIFSPYGVLLNSALATRGDDGTHVTRLETTFDSDFPASHTTLRVGDAIVRPGSWGNAVRFGGVQFGTNYSTEPGFITFPTQPVRGQALVPSLVDVYVNNALVATRRVDPGPFGISNVPFTTGSGTVRLVVRDINNHEQVLTVFQPFYSANTLLRSGLSDYSFEAGKVRQDFGLESASYGAAFGTGTFRHGMSDRFTGEVRAEAAQGTHAAGLSATALQPAIGQFDATVAASQSADASGRLLGVGFQRITPVFTFGGQGQWASPGFRRVGDGLLVSTPRMQGSVNTGVQAGSIGSFNASFVTQRFRERPRIDVVSLGYGLSLGTWGQLNVVALRTLGEDNGYAITAGVTVPLGPNMNAGAQVESTGTRDEHAQRALLSFQRNRSADSPYSYRALVRGDDLSGAVQYRGNTYEAEIEVIRVGGGPVTSRAELSGGIGWVGGYSFLSRRITGSFGVVQVADYPDVGILFENQLIGRTNRQGFFVIPELRAYDRNLIAVREADLPLDATVAALKLDASPYYRSGLLIRFPVRHIRAGVLYFTLEDGSPLPSGAVVRIDGEGEEFPAALNGEVYVSGLADRSRLVATWKGRSCAVEVVYPETKDPLPDLGRYVCKGVRA